MRTPAPPRITLCLLMLLSVAPLAAHAEDEVPVAVTRMGPVRVGFMAGTLKVAQPQVLHWIATAQKAVTHYYGRYPVPEVRIRVEAPARSPRQRFRHHLWRR